MPGPFAHPVEKGVRDPHRRHGIGHEDRGRFLAAGAGVVAAALWREAGIDKDEIEFEAVKAAAQGGDLCVVVDVEMLDPDLAARFVRELL